MLFSNIMQLPIIENHNKNIKKIKIVPTNVKDNFDKIKKIKEKLDNFMYKIHEKCYISYTSQTDDIMFTYGDNIFDKHGLFSLDSALTINNKQTSNNPFAEILRDDLNGYYNSAYNSLQSALLKYGKLVDELKKAQNELNWYLKKNNKKKLIFEYEIYSNYYEKFKLTTKELQIYFRNKTNEMLKKYSDMDKCFKQEELKLPNINLSNNRNVNKIEKNNDYNPYRVNNNNHYNNINANKNKYRVNPYQLKCNVFPNPFEHNVYKNNNIMLKPNNINQIPVLKNYNGYDPSKLNGFPMPNYNQKEKVPNIKKTNINIINIQANIPLPQQNFKGKIKLKPIKNLEKKQNVLKGQNKMLANIHNPLNKILKNNELSESQKQAIEKAQKEIDNKNEQLELKQKKAREELAKLNKEQHKINQFFAKQANNKDQGLEQEFNKLQKEVGRQQNGQNPQSNQNLMNKEIIDAEKDLENFLNA